MTTDMITKKRHSRMMLHIQDKSTKMELEVCEIVTDLGRVFRANDRSLPGAPNIIVPGLQVCIEVNGCFRHRYSDSKCPTKGKNMPEANAGYRVPKLKTSTSSSRRKADRLRRLGWRVLTIRECELRDPGKAATKMRRFIEASRTTSPSSMLTGGGQVTRPRSYSYRRTTTRK